MGKRKIKIWAIYWRDAHTTGTWEDYDSAIKFSEDSWNEPNISFGQILKTNKKYIIIHSSVTTNKQLIGDITMIPCALIIKRLLLKEIDEWKK